MNDTAVLTACFNEWMRRYIDEPDRFAREWQSVTAFLQETAEGHEPSYGASCTAYLHELAHDLAHPAPAPSPALVEIGAGPSYTVTRGPWEDQAADA